jgi:hypothetical protein
VKYTLGTPVTTGTYQLNTTATTDFSQAGRTRAAAVVQQLKTHGAGTLGKSVFGVYGLNFEPESSPDFKAVEFVGYDGTFNPAAVVSYEKTQLQSARVVPAGPHGGNMLCGYDVSNGSQVSECLWVTTSTFGEVDFVAGQSLAKYTGDAPLVALNVRDAVEIAAH